MLERLIDLARSGGYDCSAPFDPSVMGEPALMKTYGPNRFEQSSAQSFFNGVTPPAGGIIQIVLSSGSAFVYGSTTDNRTNDSHIQFAARR